MDIRILIIAIIGVFSTIIGLIYWVIKSREKLIYKDVCEERSGRLQDCIEGEVRFSKERYETLTKKIDDGFRDIKGELKNARTRN